MAGAAPSHPVEGPARCGVLLVNLGTPDAPTRRALRRYLAEFLADPRVVELPRWLWRPLLHGVILNVRPARSARAYARIWTDQGSPLWVYSRALADALAEALGGGSEPLDVVLAMRYGRPSIAEGLAALERRGVRRVLVLPLYPQYASATVGSTLAAVMDALRGRRRLPALRWVTEYHDFPPYLDALAESVRRHWARDGRPQCLVFSFHGLPQRTVLAGDPYHQQCLATAAAVAARLGLGEGEWRVAFQSRFGPARWLEPATDGVLRALPGEGVRDVAVICPGFAADCLETLEEIAIGGRETFLAAGGERFAYIPALNAEPAHVAALAALIRRNLQGWWPEDARQA